MLLIQDHAIAELILLKCKREKKKNHLTTLYAWSDLGLDCSFRRDCPKADKYGTAFKSIQSIRDGSNEYPQSMF